MRCCAVFDPLAIDGKTPRSVARCCGAFYVRIRNERKYLRAELSHSPPAQEPAWQAIHQHRATCGIVSSFFVQTCDANGVTTR
jgi:hypothetical protein